MSVNSQATQYQDALAEWTLVSDCVIGEKAVKYRKEKYLPRPNPSDKSQTNKDRYEQYLARAMFVNYTGRTLRALIGSVFRKDPVIELPSTAEYLAEDASRNGITLKNLIKLSTAETLKTGRAGLLADYPQAEEGLTLAETMANRAYVIHYDAKDIINWHVNQGGQLDLVVLRESEEVQEGTEFNYVREPRYRVLIMVDGEYQQWYYDEGGVRVWEATPRKSDGSTFNELPWSWIGSEDNDEDLDIPPLADIARVNIGHYRNSADFEETSFITGQGTFHIDIGEMSPEQFKEANPNGVMVGSRGGIQTRGGKVEIVQGDPNTLPDKAMSRKEEQMVAIGARIIQDTSGTETAEAARIRHSGENSMLATVVQNVEAAYLRIMGYIGEFMGVTQDASIELNRDFFDSNLSAQDVMAIIQSGDAGIVARSDQRKMMRTGRIELDSERDDEAIDGEIAGQSIL